MEKEILKYIEKYQTIIIHRHKEPDLDAFGSQLGLYEVIKENYPNKNVYVVGDLNRYPYDIQMDEISDETYQGALAFILDTSVDYLVSDERYKLAESLIIFDHHLNETNLTPNLFYHQTNRISCSEMVAEFAIKNGLKINLNAAKYMFAGIIGDSGRFQYINHETGPHALYISSELMKHPIDIKELYNFLYLEPLERRLVKNKFADFNLSPNNVAYRFNTNEMIKASGLEFASVSRGMVNGMAGIKEVPIWANFSENDEGKVIAELRSRDIPIVDIAKKYGGGGHLLACGATLKNFDEAKKMIEDLDERIVEHGKNTKDNL